MCVCAFLSLFLMYHFVVVSCDYLTVIFIMCTDICDNYVLAIFVAYIDDYVNLVAFRLYFRTHFCVFCVLVCL